MARLRITTFSKGWCSTSSPVRNELGLSIVECGGIMRTKDPDGTWLSRDMPDNMALRWGAAFEKSGCAVEVLP